MSGDSATKTTTGLRIGVLGPLAVTREGLSVDLGGPKQRAVLAMILAAQGEAISRDQVIEGVWGEEASTANRNSFYTYVSNLRGGLADILVRRNDMYWLDIEPMAVDAWAFGEAVNDARASAATDPLNSAVRLREALGWWRGRPYADLLDIPGLDSEIRRLEQSRLEAVELRVDSELAAGLHATLVAELDALAEEHPTRERFRAQHMLALYRAGRQTDALRAFRRTESFLSEEMGIEPSQELRDLELKILQHDDSLLVGAGRIVTQRLAFLVTSIEDPGSLWDRNPQAMAEALTIHDEVLNEAIRSERGQVFRNTGDEVLAVFPTAVQAVLAAEKAQRGFAVADWGEIDQVKVRMGIDTGESEERGGEFHGPPLNRAARLCAAGHGGQVLISPAAQAEVSASAPPGVQVRQLGEFHLRGMAGAERIAQLVLEGLPSDFPKPVIEAGSTLAIGGEAVSLPGYEIRDRIGAGTFGVVWRAYQPSVGREVAVKVIRPELASRPDFVRRFEAEARTIARLAHPHIVPLIDFWRDTDTAYLVIAYLPGGSLADLLDEGSPNRESAITILHQVGQALDHAYAHGLTHGDVKPANILLDGSGNAYLSDFSIASRLSAGTMSGSSAMRFQAPELAGSGATAATDLYSFGVLAWDLLGGARGIEDVIARATAVDPADRYPTAASFLAELSRALGDPSGGIDLPRVIRNPYKGLRAFDEADAGDFHGRAELISGLLAALTEHRLVAVVGPSGSGKSSAVRAGLLPALSEGAISGSERWFRIVLTPGSDPVASLADRLAWVSTEPVTPDLLKGRGLAGFVEGDLLVVIDQFEEVYTLSDSGTREEFVDLLADALSDAEGRVRILVTLRADFYDRPLGEERLGRLVRDGLVTVLPPTRDEILEMITGPATRAGLQWDPELPYRIAEDVAAQPGGLPLLQYALTEMVEYRADSRLSIADYARSGGVSGALTNRAEAVFAELEAAQQRAARQLLLRLVTVDEDSDVTRRRVRLTELESLGLPRQDVTVALELFTSQRLLLADRDPATRTPTVEVAHEALLREWPRLRGWIDDQREALILGRRFRTALAEWETNQRDEGYLLTGSRLAPFVGWVESTALTAEEQNYYQTSKVRDETERNARRRRRRVLITVLASTAVVATTLGIFAAIQASRASTEADRALAAEAQAEQDARLAREAETRAAEDARLARARQLSAAAMAVVDSNPALAKLLALEAAALAPPSSETLSVFHRSLNLDPVMGQYTYDGGLQPGEQRAYSVAFLSPDGTRAVGSSQHPAPQGFVEVYDFETGEMAWSYSTGSPNKVVERARFTNDGTRVVAGVYWWSGNSGEGPLPGDTEGLGIHVWNAATGELLDVIGVGRCGGKIDFVAGDVAVLTTVDTPGCYGFGVQVVTLELVYLGTFERTLVSESAWSFYGPVQSTWGTLSGDGQRLAYSEADGDVNIVYDVGSGERILELAMFREEANRWSTVRSLNHDGSLLVTGGSTLDVWDVAAGALVSTFTGPSGTRDVVFADDGTTVYSIGTDSTLRVWHARSGKERASYPNLGLQGVLSVSHNGRILAGGARQHTYSLLDLTLVGLWRVTTCGHVTYTGTLRATERLAVFSEFCDGVDVTHVVDLNSRTVSALDHFRGEALDLTPDGTGLVRQEAVYLDNGRWMFTPPRIIDPISGDLVVEMEGCEFFWGVFDNCDPTTEGGGMPRFAQGFSFSPDGRFLGMLTPNLGSGTLAVWEAGSGELVTTRDVCAFVGPFDLAFSADGETLFVSCIGDGQIGLISTTTWEELDSGYLAYDLPSRAVYTFVGHFPEHGVLVAFAGHGDAGDAELYWLDDETFEVVYHRPRTHASAALASAVSPDRTLIATGSADGFIGIWSVADRTLEQEIYVGQEITGLAFVGNSQIAATHEGGSFVVYNLDTEQLIASVRQSLHRGFTPSECSQYGFETCPTLEDMRRRR